MKKVEVICPVCGKKFLKDIRRINEARKNGWNLYCSPECRKEAKTKKVKVICANCGKEIWKTSSELKESKSGNHFCSISCSTSFNNKLRPSKSEEEKEKISIGLHKYFSEHTPYNKSKYKKIGRKYECTCKICGKIFYSTKRTATHCSRACQNSDSEYQEHLRLLAYERISSGKHKGWKSRNITSYPEQFWINVLENNNISFIREDHTNGKYFLDFLIEKNNIKIDLEIDGKQHEYPDRMESDLQRDIFLQNLGYTIYRIKWNSINNIEGSNLMREKINAFLEYYNSI